ncbi:MAG: phytochelatin synthase family protein [Polyangiales bacterium]
MRHFIRSCVVALLSLPALASAQQLPLPGTLVALDSPEGMRLLDESQAKVDYVLLSEHFVTQDLQGFCGVASAVMVLNALKVQAPTTAKWDPYRSFNQENVFNEAATKTHSADGVSKGGMTIDQLADLLQCHPAKATAVHAKDSSVDAFRAEAAKNLATAGDFIIINWDRKGLGMETMGHISPLGAYDAKADKMLIMDVARYKYAPHWVDTKMLFDAMNTDDLSSQNSRGWVTAVPASTAPGPVGAKARNMFQLLMMVVAAAFVIGITIGATIAWLVTRSRWKKRLSAAPTASPA